MIKHYGLWWEYSPSEGSRKILIMHSDFTAPEAEELGRDLYSRCLEARAKLRGIHQVAKVADSSFYVYIESTGAIKLPVLRGTNEAGRTLDSSEILGFRATFS